MQFAQPVLIFLSFALIFCIVVVVQADDQIQKTIIVDASGNGDFTSVQKAIDSIPSRNDKWVRIILKPGHYIEKVIIPSDKPFIALEGSGRTVSKISWDGHNGTRESATFTIFADNVAVKWISFTNTYNHVPMRPRDEARPDGNPRTQAVAMEIFGDKVAFYSCGFFGMQDTLCDFQGRHYFYNCFVEGAVDFIFGQGQSIYERTEISVIAGDLQGIQDGLRGFITAQHRQKADDTNGFVFKDCSIFGNGSVYLGRPWGPYARVVFFRTTMSNVVVPEGWLTKGCYDSDDLTFAEEGCLGPGSEMSKRVSWEKKLSESELCQLVNLSYINSDGWLEQQP